MTKMIAIALLLKAVDEMRMKEGAANALAELDLLLRDKPRTITAQWLHDCIVEVPDVTLPDNDEIFDLIERWGFGKDSAQAFAMVDELLVMCGIKGS